MLLVLDIGNTRLKWAGFEAGAIVSRGAIFLAEIEHFVERAGLNRNPPERVVGSHVANAASKDRIERQLPPVFVSKLHLLSHWTKIQLCKVNSNWDSESLWGYGFSQFSTDDDTAVANLDSSTRKILWRWWHVSSWVCLESGRAT